MTVVHDAYAARSRTERRAKPTANANGVTSALGHDISDAKSSDISVSDAVAREAFVVTTVSFLVLVGGNTAAWLLLLEALSFALSFELSNTMRLNVAVGLAGVLSITWALLRILFRQQNTL